MQTSLSRATPESQGIASSAILSFIDGVEADDRVELHSLVLLRHGQVVAEAWWPPYSADGLHMLYSLSKSFTSTAAGLAVAEGRFSLDDTVVSFFPDDLPEEIGPNLAAMRVRHLLAMATGHAEDTTRFMGEATDGNWVKAFLARPVEYQPGTHFLYNSGATYMVSAIIQKLAGCRLTDYLRPRLFDPLGIIDTPWDTCPRGIDVGGWGLSLTTEDIARFGQLYLQNGQWNGGQLLPEGWVREATASHISNGAEPENDWHQGYGFQFWRCRHNAYRGDGAFGQYCVVMPEQDAVVAITSNVTAMQAVLNGVWEHLLPAMAANALPEDAAAHGQLCRRLDALAIAAPAGQRTSPTAAQVSGKRYQFAENDQKLKAVAFEFGPRQADISVEDEKGTYRLTCGYGEWHDGATTFLQERVWHRTPARQEWRVMANGAWTADDTFAAKLCFYQTPFTPTVACQFLPDGRLLVDLQGSIGFGPSERPQLQGYLS